MNENDLEELALWRALRKSVVDHPELGVTTIGAKPKTAGDDVRVTIGKLRFNVLLEEVRGE